MLARIAAMCGASFGASAMTVRVGIGDRIALRADACDITCATTGGCRRPSTAGRSSGKCVAEVAQRERAQNRVGERVQQHVRVGMTLQAAPVAES